MLSAAGGALTARNFYLQASRPSWVRPPWIVIAFLIGLAVPWIIPVGPLNLSVYRLVLLATLLPSLFSWLRGALGFKLPDLALLIYSVWVAASLFAAHDPSAATQTSGIFFVETMGAYLLARRYVRDAAELRGMVLIVTLVVLVLSPFAVYEWITGNKPLLTSLSVVFPTVEVTMMVPRWGFWRVQGPFSHSIEFGLFCTSIVALTHLAWGHSNMFVSRWFLTGAVAATAFLSMSSAPISCLLFQAILMTYAWLLQRNNSKWTILWSIVAVAFLAAQFGTNQGAAKFFISHFTFDPQTGWYRVAIWDFGSASVLNHPLLGIGLADWERPRWMASDSVDNFWLLTAMRHGIPALVLLLGSCIFMMIAITTAGSTDRTVEICRVAYLISMITFLFVGATIHFSHGIYAWFMFVVGSGAWLMDSREAGATMTAEADVPPQRKTRRQFQMLN